ncbi:MAG: DUF3368 domain-containing protein [Bacteroidia bacterium]
MLKAIFNEIIVTEEIKAEFGESLPEWVVVTKVIDKKRQKVLELDLDPGEASAIALGLESDNPLLLIDEKKGRRIAKELGLNVSGTIGLFIRAREKKLITSLKIELEKLKQTDFRVSDRMIAQILEKYE